MSIGETNVYFTYGTKFILPIKIRLPTYKISVENLNSNKEGLSLNIDLLEEKRRYRKIRLITYQQRMANHYNHSVKPLKIPTR